MSDIPLPGSRDAIVQGCRCDPVKNGFGNAGAGGYLPAQSCPLHGDGAASIDDVLADLVERIRAQNTSD
jgi:hypothetical protein